MYLIISPSLFSSTSQPMLISLGLQKFDTLKMSETKEDVESATTLSSISNLTEEVPKKLEELLATPAGDPEAQGVHVPRGHRCHTKLGSPGEAGGPDFRVTLA